MSNQLSNAHDAFFKQSLSNPQLAGTFLREQLPADVADLLGPELPEPIPGSFVDEELRQHHSDLLFRVRLKEGRSALAYVLVEHKSAPDRGARLQLLRYVARILTDWYRKNECELPLPPVLPLVVNQGPEGWAFSSEFSDLFGTVSEPLTAYLPAFRHALIDLTKIDDEDLSADDVLRACLKALKNGRREDLNECLIVVMAEAPTIGSDNVRAIVVYLDKVSKVLKHETVRDTLSRLVPEQTERIMGCITQPFYDKGRAEGETAGEAKALARILEGRFGALPESVRQRIFAADVGEIDSWLDRVCYAVDLQSVFDSN